MSADLAKLTHAEHLAIPDDAALEEVVPRAFHAGRAGHPVLVGVAIDYSQPTDLTKGVVGTNFW